MSERTRERGTVEQRPGTDPDGIQSMHDILSCWERRALLYYLQEREDPASLDDLAAHVAGWRRGDDAAATDDEAVRAAERTLRRDHLRKMEAFGVLSYEPREDVVDLVDGMTVAVSRPWRHRDVATVDLADVDLEEPDFEALDRQDA